MSEKELSNASNIIGKGTQLDGNLTTTGNLRVEGKVKGSIQTKMKVVLGETSVVEGDIMAQNAEIGGEVRGAIRTSGLLTLKPSALVHGDIITGKLIFEEGAKFNGKCNMGGLVKDSRPTDLSSKVQAKTGDNIAPKPSTENLAQKAKVSS